MTVKTHYRACHLCEAICGLEIKTENDKIVSIKGDPKDPLSRGHICPKAIALQDLHEDPDRIRSPLKKVGKGWQEVSWQQAISEVSERIAELQSNFGDNGMAVYAGNPNVHNYGSLTHGRVLRKALATKNNFSATSLDQLPHHLVALQLFGHQFMVPVPDIDRTDFMLIIGANPLASNGSMMTVPDVKKRLQAIQSRGGKFIVVDPRRSETAEIADAHYFIKPGADAYFLLALLNVVLSEGLVDLGHLATAIQGLDDVKGLVESFTPELAQAQCGVDAMAIRELAREFAAAKSAVCYGRMGVSVQAYGSLCQWAIHLLNIVTGNMDSPGGAMLPSSAVGYVKPGEPAPGHIGRLHSRVSGLPEFGGEFPSTVLAEEILTPGEGQIKGLMTIAGNPVLSAPNGRRLDQAFENLDLMVSIDFYVNETTRHADYILPPTGPLEHDHYDVAFHRLAVRNTARFNEPVFDKPSGSLHDWEIMNSLGEALGKLKDIRVSPLPPPHMLIDMGLQMGPYGSKVGHEAELSLEVLKNNPHGVDLGPMRVSMLERLCTEDKTISLLSPLIQSEVLRLLEDSKGVDSELPLRLIGRRHVRSNNSWMHNYHRLVKGKPRWQCLMHPDDMKARELNDGQEISIRSRVASLTTQVLASEEVMPGVISIPHGWGHKREGVQLSVASQQGGVSVNDLTDDQFYDRSTGNAALNGVPVEVSAVV